MKIKLLICLLLMLFISACTSIADNELTIKEKEDGWKLLFDGKSLSQWVNYGSDDINGKWVIKDGVFYIADTSGEAGDIVTKKEYGNIRNED